MELERTVNSEVEVGWMGRASPVWLSYRGPVSGRSVRTLIFPHSLLMEEDSRSGLVLVALGARVIGALAERVASEAQVGRVRRLVSTLPLSGTVGPPRRSFPRRPVSEAGSCLGKVWQLLTMTC
jgi:hypothetical protein